MKVDKTPQPAPLDAVGGDRAAARGQRASAPAVAAQDTDSVSLSAQSRDLQRLGASAAEPAFDADKVAEIRAAIAAGTFKVDAGKVADGLIGSVKEMLSRKPGA